MAGLVGVAADAQHHQLAERVVELHDFLVVHVQEPAQGLRAQIDSTFCSPKVRQRHGLGGVQAKVATEVIQQLRLGGVCLGQLPGPQLVKTLHGKVVGIFVLQLIQAVMTDFPAFVLSCRCRAHDITRPLAICAQRTNPFAVGDMKWPSRICDVHQDSLISISQCSIAERTHLRQARDLLGIEGLLADRQTEVAVIYEVG